MENYGKMAHIYRSSVVSEEVVGAKLTSFLLLQHIKEEKYKN